ncbi:hypothetical protein [Phenylobacterium sp.]|uniref:terminase small subunit-like protein n=1 Tax=Phenylobacterium sp. TaxID=1871053 RepID=UPI0027372CF3|nr:hypothetical protein [Phenylobacterium sp.]MDP3855382.1 hypothetical protein [Phenylobacterium sp.]
MTALPARIAGYTSDLGAEIARRVEAGESIRSIGADRAMPAAATIHRWLGQIPEFAEQRRVARSAARRAAASAHAEMIEARKARRKHDWGRSDLYAVEIGEKICQAIAAGRSMVEICAEPDMPVTGTVYEWLRAHPDFSDMYVQARDIQAELLADEAWVIAKAAAPATVPVARLQFDVIRWRAARLAPKTWGETGKPAAPRLNIFVQNFGDGEVISGPGVGER